MLDATPQVLPDRQPIFPTPSDPATGELVAELLGLADREQILVKELAALRARRDAIIPLLPDYSVRSLANICRVSFGRVGQIRRRINE